MSWLQSLVLLPARRPRTTLAGLAGLVLLGALGVAYRGVQLDFGVEQFVPQGDPLFARYAELNAQFGRDDNTAFVFVAGADWFSPQGAALLLELTRELGDSEMVAQVVGPASATLVHDEGDQLYVGPVLTPARLKQLTPAQLRALGEFLRQEPVYAGRLISPDGRTVAFAVRVKEAYYGGHFHRRITQHVERVAARCRQRGLQVWISGGPPTQDAYRRFLIRDSALFVFLTCLLLGLALWVTFRSWQGVVLPLAAVGLGLVFTGVFLSLAGYPVNLLSSAIPVLVLIVGVSDAIHLLTRYAEELAEGLPRQEALERALTVTASACLLTSVTTAVGFFVLLSAGIPMLADMGVVTGAGVLIAYTTTLTVVPALAALTRTPDRLPPSGEATRLHRMGCWVMDRPWRVSLGLLGVLLVLAAVGVPRLRVESRVVDDLPADHPVVQTRAAIEQRLGGNYPLTFLVHPRPQEADPSQDLDLLLRVRAFQQRLRADAASAAQPYLSSALSLVDYVGLAWRELGGEGFPSTEDGLAQVRLFLGDAPVRETMDRRGRFLRMQLRVYDRGTHATFAFLERARKLFAETVGERATLEVQGFTYLAHRTHRAIVWSSMTSFSLDFLIVAGLVWAVFRSLPLTLLAIAPNVFPLVCTVAFMGLAGIDLRISSAIVFSIVFGIAVDDTVHFLARFHEERDGGLDARAATAKTIATTGRAMLFMAFVLAAGFGVLVFSAFSPNRVLGLLMSVTVLSGILGDLVLLPALLVLGKR